MILNVDINNSDGIYYGSEDIDLGELYELDWVASKGDLGEALKVAVAEVAIRHETPFYNVSPDYVQDTDGDTVSVRGEMWLSEVAEFAWFLFQNSTDEDDHLKFFAYVENQGWEYFDFYDLRYVEDKFYAVMSNLDAESYARERMEDSGEDLPAHLSEHFDYQSYGEELLEEFSQVDYGGSVYLFTE